MTCFPQASCTPGDDQRCTCPHPHTQAALPQACEAAGCRLPAGLVETLEEATRLALRDVARGVRQAEGSAVSCDDEDDVPFSLTPYPVASSQQQKKRKFSLFTTSACGVPA